MRRNILAVSKSNHMTWFVGSIFIFALISTCALWIVWYLQIF
jgi:hypothetical protein